MATSLWPFTAGRCRICRVDTALWGICVWGLSHAAPETCERHTNLQTLAYWVCTLRLVLHSNVTGFRAAFQILSCLIPARPFCPAKAPDGSHCKAGLHCCREVQGLRGWVAPSASCNNTVQGPYAPSSHLGFPGSVQHFHCSLSDLSLAGSGAGVVSVVWGGWC